MTELEYKFTNDTLFKMLFVDYPDLLQKLVAALLDIPFDSIGDFAITNPEMPPESLGEKFCRLDINMIVNEQRVDLELQVADQGDFSERSLYYWAREYSSALPEGGAYSDLPRTVVISIVAFKMFDCAEYHSEFRLLEVTRHTQLTDKQSLHYFELPKLPKLLTSASEVRAFSGQELWLALFSAKTEEELRQIEELGVPEMTQAVSAYRNITVTEKFREAQRLRELAGHNEASALRFAHNEGKAEGIREADIKWQVVVADKDAILATKDTALANKDAALANKDAEIARLLSLLDSGK